MTAAPALDSPRLALLILIRFAKNGEGQYYSRARLLPTVEAFGHHLRRHD
ncbi:hypothetical protein [Cupriavidus necator]